MNKILKTVLGATVATVVAGTTLAQGTVSAWSWGDNSSDSGRTSYTISEINSGVLGNKVVLNSISDGVIGNEKNFVAAREYNGARLEAQNDWQADEITVQEGKTYMIRLYVHNNNPSKDVKATGVHTMLSIAQGTDTQLQVNGFIDVAGGNNVVATEYWDDIIFKSADGRKFRLDYVEGSAILQNNRANMSLSDDIVKSTSGVQIGYDATLNGEIPGCFDYATYVAIQVKPVFEQPSEPRRGEEPQQATNFTIEKKVRRVGETEWHPYVEGLKVGDKVEYQIHYENTSAVESTNVMIQDSLPSNLRYIAGTARLINTTHPTPGMVLEDTVVATGANIGGYLPQGDGYVRFTAEVVDEDLSCGITKLINWSKATVATATAQDSADVYVNKDCGGTPASTPKTGETETIPATGPIGVVGGVVGAGAIVTSAGYYIASRRKLG